MKYDRTPRLAQLVLMLALCCFGCDRATHAVAHWELEVDGVARGAVELPAHLNDRIPDRDLRYELHTRYRLPAELAGRELDFVLPHFWAHTALWVDGAKALRTDAGTPRGHRSTVPHVFRIPAEAGLDGALELRLVVQHRWTQSAWFDVQPRLLPAGTSDSTTRWARFFNETVSIVASALLFQIGIAALLIYFIGGRRREYLWLGMQALCAASYPAFVHGELQLVFGRYDVSALGTFLIGAVWASLRFARAVFELGPLPRRWDVLCAVGVLCCFLGLSPYWSTLFAAGSTIVVVSFGVISQVSLAARLMLNPEKRKDARWFAGCWYALMLTTWSDMATWAGLGESFGGAHVACVGLAAFSFFLSLMLSQRHLSSLSRSDRLAAELEQRVHELERHGREIEQLNSELRRQIAERSEQIYAALSLRDGNTPAVKSLAVGEVVQGRYRVLNLRGAGGMGAVYEVERLSDGTHLALKLARETHGQALALLAREAQIAAQLSHPNVVKIVDVDVASSGFLFLVMELVDGKPLQQLAVRYGDAAWALSVLRQVASGLATLHRAGIVHRDVKPPNILVSEQAGKTLVKLTDFGIARFSPATATRSERPEQTNGSAFPRAEGATTLEFDTVMRGRSPAYRSSPAVMMAGDTGLLTRSGQVAGTPLYMAPELARRGNKATPKADVYSLGVLAWELLANRKPSMRPAAAAVLAGEIPEPMPSVAPVARALPRSVTDAIDACLSFDPDLRPSAEELEAVFALAER